MLGKETLDKAMALYNLPDWATHVAVSRVRDKAEPCAFYDGEYFDCDPKSLEPSDWGGGYKKAYWDFVSIADVNAHRNRTALEIIRRNHSCTRGLVP